MSKVFIAYKATKKWQVMYLEVKIQKVRRI